MAKRAQFEVRDVGQGSSSDDSGEGNKKYTGVERRRGNRRSGKERRTEVRFEINKEDRRQNHGRRHDDNSPTFW